MRTYKPGDRVMCADPCKCRGVVVESKDGNIVVKLDDGDVPGEELVFPWPLIQPDPAAEEA